MGAKQGVHDFLRAYFHVKSADWKGNNPFPLKAFSATELEELEPVKEHLVLARYAPSRVDRGDMLSVKDVEEILGIPLLGVIPESESVLLASNSGNPVVLDTDSDAGQAYQDLVARFLGENRPHRFLTAEKRGLLKRLFGN
jgi:septum site-determining protein MinD